MKLYAPEDFWQLSRQQRKALCNGCGPGKFLGFIVPDTLWGLSITPACDIHDFMYATGETIEDKTIADRVFLNNMIRIVRANTNNFVLLKLRLKRAKTYYYGVSTYGGPFYWNSKNKPKNLGEHK